MRILAFSDIHGNYEVYRHIRHLATQHRVDAVVFAGDLLGVPDGFQEIEEAQRADTRNILEILKPLSIPVLYIMGNDDMVELESKKENFQSIHMRRVDFKSCNFVGYQYSLPFMGGIFEKSEVEIEKDMISLEPYMDNKTVLVTHCPAKGILDHGVMNTSVGSSSILSTIVRYSVRAHIHGHVHSCFGREGRHFNVASGGKFRGMLIDLATMKHEVIDEELNSSNRIRPTQRY